MNDINAKTYALETAKAIVVSRMSSANHNVDKERGFSVGQYFEEIYKKIYELAKD